MLLQGLIVEQPFVSSALVEFTSRWSLCLVFLQKLCSHAAISNMQVDYVAMGPVGSHESERTRSQHEFVHAGCLASSLSHASQKLHICICSHTKSRLIHFLCFRSCIVACSVRDGACESEISDESVVMVSFADTRSTALEGQPFSHIAHQTEHQPESHSGLLPLT
jgi:hypothetical protein